jgi:quercetin dioxygenase-like cupin family protein
MVACMDTITPTPAISGYAFPAGEGERLWIVGDTMSVKASAASTGGSLSLFEVDAAPGGGPPPHLHTHEDEAFYVLDGEFEILVGDRLHTGGPGTFAFVPRGTVHRFACTGQTPGRILVMFTPGGIDGFFREAGRPAIDDGPAPPLDDSEIARTELAAPRYGLQLVDRSGTASHPTSDRSA